MFFRSTSTYTEDICTYNFCWLAYICFAANVPVKQTFNSLQPQRGFFKWLEAISSHQVYTKPPKQRGKTCLLSLLYSCLSNPTKIFKCTVLLTSPFKISHVIQILNFQILHYLHFFFYTGFTGSPSWHGESASAVSEGWVFKIHRGGPKTKVPWPHTLSAYHRWKKEFWASTREHWLWLWEMDPSFPPSSPVIISSVNSCRPKDWPNQVNPNTIYL